MVWKTTALVIFLVLFAAVLPGCVGQNSPPKSDATPPATPAITRSPVSAPTPDKPNIPSVKVLPVFFIPAGGKGPVDADIQLLNKHLLIAQSRYNVMMKERDTFGISSEPAVIYTSPHELQYFRKAADRGGAKYTIELLQYLNVTRYECPYILLIVVMNPADNFPLAGGRPINGGVGKGGGIIIVSSYYLNDADSAFQSTLQHELGHSFGLLHVDAYGYDMNTSKSLMSYNPENQWTGVKRPASEAILIPEDLYGLSENKQVFLHFFFNPEKDMPAGHRLNTRIDTYPLSPMDLTSDHFGYELFFDGKRVGHEPDWSSRQAIENLLGNFQRYPDKKVEGRYEDGPILISGTGYELYFSGVRVGHEPAWSREQALQNLLGNIRNHPETEVVGIYNRVILT